MMRCPRIRLAMLLLVCLSAATLQVRPDASEKLAPSKTPKCPTPRNMVKNGDFELVSDGSRPDNWEEITHPGIEVVDVGPPHGNVLRLNLSRRVARTTGLMYYSNAIAVGYQPPKLV